MSNKFVKNLKNDIPAGIIVFFVALPLCLGIAMASGTPTFSGILAGIIGGIVVALISNSALGVSGPAAGLAVIVLNAINELGSFEIFLLAALIGGVIQLILGFCKAGIVAYYFPSAVIKGMLSGIGIIIFMKQIPHIIGDNDVGLLSMEFIQDDGHTTISELYYMLEQLNVPSIIVSFSSLFIYYLWSRKFMQNHSIFKIIQAPLVVVVVGILLTYLLPFFNLSLTKDRLVNIPIFGDLSDITQKLSFPDFSQWNNFEVYKVGFTIAIVASLETLLCVEATDKLDPKKRITPTNRELKAQGVGNIISSAIGGLPITQVIVRSSANIQSGGKSKYSAVFHGILLLLAVLFIAPVINKVPFASLASILLVIGYKLAKPSIFIDMYKKHWDQFIPFIITVLGIVFTDMLIGICLGLIVGVLDILWKNYNIPFTFEPKAYLEGIIRLKLPATVSFLNKARILKVLSSIPRDKKVIIDGSNTKNIHPDVLEFFEEFKEGGMDIQVIGLEKNHKYNPIKHFNDVVHKEKK